MPGVSFQQLKIAIGEGILKLPVKLLPTHDANA